MAGTTQQPALGATRRRWVWLVAIVALFASMVGVPAQATPSPAPSNVISWGTLSGTSQASAGTVTGISHVVALAAGGDHNLAVASDGSLYAWGSNGNGQLGVGTPVSGGPPTLTKVTLPLGVGALKDVAAGANHSLALFEDANTPGQGTVWAWGANDHGQASNVSAQTATNTDPVPGPRQVYALNPGCSAPATAGNCIPTPLVGVSAISAGNNHNIALKPDGTLWAWGDNTFGQLGNSTFGVAANPFATQVLNIPLNPPVFAVAAGGGHSLALARNPATDARTVYAWGDNAKGQAGQDPTFTPGTTNCTVCMVPLATAVTGTPLAKTTAIAAGGAHSVALLGPDGTVSAWGDNTNGQLGRPSGSLTPTFTALAVAGETGVTKIAAGGAHTIALRGNQIDAWGDNSAKQLGGNGGDAFSPVNLAGVASALAIVAGGNHNLAIGAPVVSITPSSLDFTKQEVGTTSGAKTIFVKNNGPGPLMVAAPTINDNQFTATSNSCAPPRKWPRARPAKSRSRSRPTTPATIPW